jgi:nucleotide-binding universal stress UspA family protein
MKTIVVLTDFSINAAYTAQYALQLAQHIEANLVLCNIYETPEGESDAKENSINDLSELMYLLKARLDDPGNSKQYRPDIEQYNKPGLIDSAINEIAAKYNVVMAIISMHNRNAHFTVNHTQHIIEHASFPVLVIPYQLRFTPYKTIAFATAMNYSDISVLQCISGLAERSKSCIVITCVIADNEENEVSVKQFFNQVPLKITYPQMLYRVIKNRNIARGLQWLTTHIDIDLLVLVNSKPNFFRRVFNGSIVQKLALNSHKPLLIFPGVQVRETLPVF